MTPRRGDSGLAGILPVDKPRGLSSHDVVNRVRRAVGERRVGHAGTLDPMATGLLVVLVGPATRLAPYLTAAEKSYVATITFGSETDTDDAEGGTTRVAAVPRLSLEEAASIVAALVGEHQQLPPDYSAVKRDGVVAYRAARAGQPIALEPRTVSISSATLLGIDEVSGTWEVALTVSKGTYIRSIARDLGRALRSAAHLSALRRTASGILDLAAAPDMAAIESASGPEDITQHFVDPVIALGLPVVDVSRDGADRVANGSPLDASLAPESAHGSAEVAVLHEGRLLAIYQASGTQLKARVVIPGGVGTGAA